MTRLLLKVEHFIKRKNEYLYIFFEAKTESCHMETCSEGSPSSACLNCLQRLALLWLCKSHSILSIEIHWVLIIRGGMFCRVLLYSTELANIETLFL